MRPAFIVAAGGALAAVGALVFGYKKAEATKNGVLAATGGDAAGAAAASQKAATAKSPSDVQAAASQAQAAANAMPASSPDVIAEALAAGAAAQAAVSPADVKAAADKVQAVTAKMTGNSNINLRLTGYWPFTAGEGEKKMEGGVNDRKGKSLHTVEDFLAGKSDHVSLSGDDSAWPYAQLVIIPWVDGKTIKGRVTDTGQHFRGLGKKYRIFGDEPIDVCVLSSKSLVPKGTIVASIVRGDNLDKVGKDIVATKFQGQIVVGSLHMLGAR